MSHENLSIAKSPGIWYSLWLWKIGRIEFVLALTLWFLVIFWPTKIKQNYKKSKKKFKTPKQQKNNKLC